MTHKTLVLILLVVATVTTTNAVCVTGQVVSAIVVSTSQTK